MKIMIINNLSLNNLLLFYFNVYRMIIIRFYNIITKYKNNKIYNSYNILVLIYNIKTLLIKYI